MNISNLDRNVYVRIQHSKICTGLFGWMLEARNSNNWKIESEGEILGLQFSRKEQFGTAAFRTSWWNGSCFSGRINYTTARRLKNWKNWILKRDLGPPVPRKKTVFQFLSQDLSSGFNFSVFQFLAQDLSSGLSFFSLSIFQFLAPYRPQNQAFDIICQNSPNAL